MGMLQKFKNTQSYLNNYSDRLVKLLKAEVESSRTRNYISGQYTNPINTTGTLANSIMKSETISGNKLSFKIKGKGYGAKIDKGDPQGSIPDIGGLIKWIQDKRLSLVDLKTGELISLSDTRNVARIAYYIGRKISLKGTRETSGFIGKVMNESLKDLNGLGDQVGKDVSLNVRDILLKAGYIKKGENYEYKFES